MYCPLAAPTLQPAVPIASPARSWHVSAVNVPACAGTGRREHTYATGQDHRKYQAAPAHDRTVPVGRVAGDGGARVALRPRIR